MLASRPAATSAAQLRAAPRYAPSALPKRASTRRSALPDPTKGGETPSKDVTDTNAPTSLRDVGAAAREATPHNAPAFQAPKLLPTFSRRREVFAGRWAMLGFAAACAWEILTPYHLGPVGITSALTGWSIPTVKLVYGAFVAHGLLGLLWPGSPTYDRNNVNDYNRRPEGPPTLAVSPIGNPAKFFGFSPTWGFTKKNELFHGRLAMLGFTAALMNEAQTGLGPSGQVAWWLGSIQPSDDFYRTAGIAVLSFAAIATGLAYASGHGGTTQGENDIY